jgi:hypothetical protein
MGDEVQVDAGVRPVVESRQVGDRRVHGDVEPAPPAQLAQDRGHPGIGRDHHVGVLPGDAPQDSSPGQQVQEALGEPAGGPQPRGHQVLQVERPWHAAEHEPRPVSQQRPQQASHVRQPVADRDPGIRIGGGQVVRDRAGR